MIDFHSHILPSMDDGARDLSTSLQMMAEASAQGVEIQIATPHFYAWEEKMKHYLARREHALQKLRDALPQGSPKLLCGAEVAYFAGIGQADALEPLTVEGSGLLLLELPFSPWNKGVVRDVSELCQSGFRVILAHLERYFDQNADLLDELIQLPVTVQLNAGPLAAAPAGVLHPMQRKKDLRRRELSLELAKRGILLGSDCHNMSVRAPNLARGRKALSDALGPEILQKTDALGSELLAPALAEQEAKA